MRHLLHSTALLTFLAATALSACHRPRRPFNPDGLAGAVLNPPMPKPSFTLTATDGRPFDFQKETQGYVTLLFVGYTHCPDVCPVHMTNIAAALQHLSPELANRVKVVFVTADPERDTPGVLRRWLDQFDPHFIGLRGDTAVVDGILNELHLGSSVREPGPTDSTYTIGHAAAVVAFTPDNLAHVIYLFGVRQSDWAHDLGQLAKAAGESPAG
jgi:protein SCO1